MTTSSKHNRRSEREVPLSLVIVALVSLSVVAIAMLRDQLPSLAEKHSIGSNLGFYLLINLNIIVVMVLTFLVFRNVIKLVLDRRRNILGSRLRTRLIVAFVGLSLVPTSLLFLTAKGIFDNILEGWFSPQIVSTVEGAVGVARFHYQETESRLEKQLEILDTDISKISTTQNPRILEVNLANLLERKKQEYGLVELALYDETGRPRVRSSVSSGGTDSPTRPALDLGLLGQARQGVSSIQPEQFMESEFIRAYRPVREKLPELLDNNDSRFGERGASGNYIVVATYLVPPKLNSVLSSVISSFDDYRELHSYKRPLASSYLLTLVMVMLLIVITAMWVGFYLAKSLTGPIQKLAEGTEEIAQGNLDYQISEVGDDELGFLVSSFNTMTSDLKRTNVELVSRRRYIETLLESLDVGVVSITNSGSIRTLNGAAARILHSENAPPNFFAGQSLVSFLGPESAEKLEGMVDKLFSSDERLISGNIYISNSSGGEVHLHVTITKLISEIGEVLGGVILLDDLTELVRAQRMAAWREVAQRIAHEIKNPLTPIQLSAQRIEKRLCGSDDARADSSELSSVDRKLVTDSTEMIVGQVEVLRGLVNEFSKFARMPTVDLRETSLNQIVRETVSLFEGLNSQVVFEQDLSESLPDLNLDREQLGRALSNLLDNAISAMISSEYFADSQVRKSVGNSKSRESLAGSVKDVPRIWLKTKHEPSRSKVVLTVSDNGPGIPDGLKSRVFEPYYTSRKNGTGLGLAIVSSIVADHNGFVRLLDNQPRGCNFVIELPI